MDNYNITCEFGHYKITDKDGNFVSNEDTYEDAVREIKTLEAEQEKK